VVGPQGLSCAALITSLAGIVIGPTLNADSFFLQYRQRKIF
jgi:hypothetical protein